MLPLSDTLVLDLTQVIAGPTGGQILGDMGADVIKVEPLNGEHFRPHFGGAWVPSMNRNKRGLAIDLRTEGGRDVLMRLVRKADVFMEAFTPGVIDKLERSLGIDQSLVRERLGVVFVVSKVTAEYLAPAKLDDELEVTIDAINRRSASMAFTQRILQRSSSALLMTAWVRVACVAAVDFRPRRIPDSLFPPNR